MGPVVEGHVHSPQQVVSAHSPTEIVDSLAQLTTCSAEVVRDLTSAIDLQRDSQELQ